MDDDVKRLAEETKGFVSDQVKALEEKHGNELEAVKSQLATITDVKKAVDTHKIELQDMKQMLSASVEKPNLARKSLAMQFIESDEYKNFVSSGTMADRYVEFKSTISADAASMGSIIQPQVQESIIQHPFPRIGDIRQLCTVGTIATDAFTYYIETGNKAQSVAGAAVIGEGDAKPLVTAAVEEKTVAVKTIGAYVDVTEQVLADSGLVRSYIEGRLLDKVRYAEAVQMFTGDGTGNNLHGLIPQATAFSATLPALNNNPVDRIAYAIGQVEDNASAANGIVLNPQDWIQIMTYRNASGMLEMGTAQTPAALGLWGKPVVTSSLIPAGKFLTGDFATVMILDRTGTELAAGLINDQFIRSKIAIRARKRLTMAVTYPQAIVYGDLVAA